MQEKLQNFSLFFVKNKRGFNFIFEAVLVLLLVLLLILGYLNFTLTKTDNSSIPMLLKINDTFIILSKENTSDLTKLNEIFEFLFPNEEVEIFLDNKKIFGNINNKKNKCIIREENIAVKENDEITFKKFKIKYCE